MDDTFTTVLKSLYREFRIKLISRSSQEHRTDYATFLRISKRNKAMVVKIEAEDRSLAWEYNLLRNVKHDNIIRPRKLIYHEQFTIIEIPYVQCMDLETLTQNTWMGCYTNIEICPVKEVVQVIIAKALLRVLSYLYKKNISHGQLYMRNVIVGSKYLDAIQPNTVIKLHSFGLSVVFSVDDEKGLMEKHKEDLFGVGVILYTIATGNFIGSTKPLWGIDWISCPQCGTENMVPVELSSQTCIYCPKELCSLLPKDEKTFNGYAKMLLAQYVSEVRSQKKVPESIKQIIESVFVYNVPYNLFASTLVRYCENK